MHLVSAVGQEFSHMLRTTRSLWCHNTLRERRPSHNLEAILRPFIRQKFKLIFYSYLYFFITVSAFVWCHKHFPSSLSASKKTIPPSNQKGREASEVFFRGKTPPEQLPKGAESHRSYLQRWLLGVWKCRNRATKLIFWLAPLLFLAVDSAEESVLKNLSSEKLFLSVQLSALVHFRRCEDMYKAYIKQTKCC